MTFLCFVWFTALRCNKNNCIEHHFDYFVYFSIYVHFIRQYKNTHAFINVHLFINELLQVGNRVKWFPQFGGVGLPLHTKQQVSGTETGWEQVIGWHVFRAQKMFPFWEKRGRQNSLLFTCQSTNCRWQGSRTPRFLQTCLFGQRRSPNNVITLFSEVLKHSSKNIMRYYIYLALVQNKLHFLSPHKDTLTQAVAELPCKVMSCWSEKKKRRVQSLVQEPSNRQQPARVPDKSQTKLWACCLEINAWTETAVRMEQVIYWLLKRNMGEMYEDKHDFYGSKK